EVQGGRAEDLVDGIVAVVADGADLAAAQVLQDEAFQEIVDVGGGEGKIDVSVALDVAFALEIADAAVEQDDLADGERTFDGFLAVDGAVAVIGILGAGGGRLPSDDGADEGEAARRSQEPCATHEILR